MLKLQIEDVRIEQALEIYRTGSIRAGTIKSGARELTLRVDVVTSEPPERVAELMRVARESCFTHGALGEIVPVTATLFLNGDPLDPA